MNESEISAELFRDNLFKLYQRGASHAEIDTYIGAYCPDLHPI